MGFSYGKPLPPEQPTPGDLDYPGLPPLSAEMAIFARVGFTVLDRFLATHAAFDQWLTEHQQPRECA